MLVLQFSDMNIRYVLDKDLSYCPYKVKDTHYLKTQDQMVYVHFWVLEILA
jgi:hypothetical protein